MIPDTVFYVAAGVLVVYLVVAVLRLVYELGKAAGQRYAANNLDGLAARALAAMDAEYQPGGPAPLRVRYQLARGEQAEGGTCTFHAFTFADWYRASVQQAIQAALLAEHPGWDVVGYAAITSEDEGEEVPP